jgi:hypothetical protein
MLVPDLARVDEAYLLQVCADRMLEGYVDFEKELPLAAVACGRADLAAIDVLIARRAAPDWFWP